METSFDLNGLLTRWQKLLGNEASIWIHTDLLAHNGCRRPRHIPAIDPHRPAAHTDIGSLQRVLAVSAGSALNPFCMGQVKFRVADAQAFWRCLVKRSVPRRSPQDIMQFVRQTFRQEGRRCIPCDRKDKERFTARRATGIKNADFQFRRKGKIVRIGRRL